MKTLTISKEFLDELLFASDPTFSDGFTAQLRCIRAKFRAAWFIWITPKYTLSGICFSGAEHGRSMP